MKEMQVHAVILAHQKIKKSLKSVFSQSFKDDTFQENNFLQTTLDLISSLIPYQRRWVSTFIEQEPVVIEKIGNAIAGVLVEPEEHGTLASMLFSAFLIEESNPYAVLLFLPSTHQILQKDKFLAFIEHAIDFVTENNEIALIGVKPFYTTYDYDCMTYYQEDGYPANIKKFYKSSEKELEQVIKKKNCVWNTEIVISKAHVFIQAIKHAAPELYSAVYEYIQGIGEYTQIPDISFQDIVMKIDTIKIFPIDCVWQDYATAYKSMFIESNNKTLHDSSYIEIDSRNNLIEAEDHLVALIGVENLCVIKRDDIVFVVHRDHIQKVQQVIDDLKKDKEKFI